MNKNEEYQLLFKDINITIFVCEPEEDNSRGLVLTDRIKSYSDNPDENKKIAFDVFIQIKQRKEYQENISIYLVTKKDQDTVMKLMLKSFPLSLSGVLSNERQDVEENRELEAWFGEDTILQRIRLRCRNTPIMKSGEYAVIACVDNDSQDLNKESIISAEYFTVI